MLMIFTETPYERMLEQMMQEVPNLNKRRTEIIDAKRLICSVTFRERSEKHICKENRIMFYRGKQHQMLFKKAIEDQDYIEPSALAAIYLLTADCRLWSQMHRFVNGSYIVFRQSSLSDATPEAYTLYIAARDLYCSAHRMTIEDVTDSDIVPNGIFNVICNALAVCRYGMTAVKFLQSDDGAM